MARITGYKFPSNEEERKWLLPSRNNDTKGYGFKVPKYIYDLLDRVKQTEGLNMTKWFMVKVMQDFGAYLDPKQIEDIKQSANEKYDGLLVDAKGYEPILNRKIAEKELEIEQEDKRKTEEIANFDVITKRLQKKEADNIELSFFRKYDLNKQNTEKELIEMFKIYLVEVRATTYKKRPKFWTLDLFKIRKEIANDCLK